MSRAIRRTWTGLVLALTGALAAPTQAALTPTDLGDASYREEVSAGPLNQQGFDLWTPENLALDYQGPGGSQAVVALIASPDGPMGDVRYSVSKVFGDNVGSGFGAGGWVRISYATAVVPLVPDAPLDVPIRTVITVMGSLSVSVSGTNTESQFSSGYGNAYVRIDGFDFGTPSGTFNVEAGIIPNRPELPSSAEFNLSFLGEFLPNTILSVEKSVSVGATTRRPDATYEGQGVIDPMFAIDPTFMVEYQGNLTPATELYGLIYSPGVRPIPEPGTLGLLTCAAAWAVARRRRSPVAPARA